MLPNIVDHFRSIEVSSLKIEHLFSFLGFFCLGRGRKTSYFVYKQFENVKIYQGHLSYDFLDTP